MRRDRVEVEKINSLEDLERARKEKNHQPIPGANSLMIDNTTLPPDIVTEKIIEYYQLLNGLPNHSG